MTSKITIDGADYSVDEMSQKARLLLDHLSDIEQQLKVAYFKIDQMQVCRDAFLGMLKAELPAKESQQVETNEEQDNG